MDKSIIATARKISSIVYTMLKTRQPFDPLEMIWSKKYEKMGLASGMYAIGL